MNVPLNRLIEITKQVFARKYPAAKVIFLAGSIVRGEATPYSDLDLVVVFETLPHAYRETFYHQNFIVETFVHDSETLNYFMSENLAAGVPTMINMVSEGIEVPAASEFSQKLKRLAESYRKQGPALLDERELIWRRYTISNLVDDIRQPRSRAELTASGADLYEVLADFYFRSNNRWSATSKSIPRALEKQNPDLAARYVKAFDELFVDGKSEPVIDLAAEILQPSGGFLLELERLNAPADKRKSLFGE